MDVEAKGHKWVLVKVFPRENCWGGGGGAGGPPPPQPFSLVNTLTKTHLWPLASTSIPIHTCSILEGFVGGEAWGLDIPCICVCVCVRACTSSSLLHDASFG
jgi:hypothetical protein